MNILLFWCYTLGIIVFMIFIGGMALFDNWIDEGY
jgi:hypothetical protein